MRSTATARRRRDHRAHASSSGAALTPLPGNTSPTSLKTIAREAARAAERVAIEAVLDCVDWNRVKAARLLHISYAALRYKILDCGLTRQGAENEGPIVSFSSDHRS